MARAIRILILKEWQLRTAGGDGNQRAECGFRGFKNAINMFAEFKHTLRLLIIKTTVAVFGLAETFFFFCGKLRY